MGEAAWKDRLGDMMDRFANTSLTCSSVFWSDLGSSNIVPLTLLGDRRMGIYMRWHDHPDGGRAGGVDALPHAVDGLFCLLDDALLQGDALGGSSGSSLLGDDCGRGFETRVKATARVSLRIFRLMLTR